MRPPVCLRSSLQSCKENSFHINRLLKKNNVPEMLLAKERVVYSQIFQLMVEIL